MTYLHRTGVGGLMLAATLALAAPTRGDASHDQAGQILTQADADLATAQQRADTAQQLADAARTRAGDIAGRLEDEQSGAKDIRERLTRAEAAVPEIQARIDSAAARQSARHKEMIVEDLNYGPLKFADEQARLDAIHDFETSPEYRASLAAVADRAAGARAVEAKSPGDPRRLAGDPNVLTARNQLAEAKKGLDELRRRFMDEQLPQIRKVKFADEALREEQAHYDGLSAAAKTAEADAAAAQAVMDHQKAGLAADRAMLDRMMTEIAQLETQSANAQADVDRSSKALTVAVAYLTSSEQSRANAQAALDQLDAPPAYVAAPSVYSYGAPPIVYIQPPPVYGGGQYYGSIYFTPARGSIYGFNPSRGGFQNHASFSDHQGHFHGNGGHGR